ncbi:hypothetical protein L0222_22315 [bacterium]|nr:hypothetical protein [bacterium]
MQYQSGYTLVEVLVLIVLGLMVIVGLYQILDQHAKVHKAQQEITVMNHQVRAAMETVVRTIRSAGSNKPALERVPRVYIAEENRIRLISDLPQDFHDPADLDGDGFTCDDTDGDTFSITDCDASGTAGDGNNENENADGLLNDEYEDVAFFLDNNQLILRQFSDDPGLETAPSGNFFRPPISITPDPPALSDDVLAQDVLELSFRYFVDSNTELTMSGSPSAVADSDLHNIKLVQIKMIGRTRNRDLSGGRFHTIELTSNVELRN